MFGVNLEAYWSVGKVCKGWIKIVEESRKSWLKKRVICMVDGKEGERDAYAY